MKKLVLLTMLVVAGATMTSAQTVYKYLFRNDLHEAHTGPDLTATCADSFISDNIPAYSLTRPVFRFNHACGFNYDDMVPNFLASGSYTIEMYASLDTVLSYRKMIDFQNSSSDGGLYLLDSSLDFFSSYNTFNALYSDGKYVFTTISRNNATQEVKLFVQGNYLGSFTDVGGDAFYDAYKKLRFFQDDSLTGYNEVSGGNIAYLAIYNYVRDPLLITNDFNGLGNILAATGVETITAQNNIQLWPNPAQNSLTVSSIAELPYIVTDVTGRNISSGTLLKGENILNVAGFSRGVYFIKVSGSNAGGVYKFVKE